MPQMLKEPGNLFVALGVAFLLFIMACSATVIYWSLDNELPITGVVGTFKGWDKNNPTVGRVEWVGQRNRYCDATVSHWIINDSRYVNFYQTTRPGLEIIDESEKGRENIIYDTVEIPPEVRNNLVAAKYRVRFEFVCNYLHKAFPLIVYPPEISIMPLDASNHAPKGP